ncbi:BfmA/BtgA family mobilization protein [Salegentibacter sp. Hel_I_6]|uniref:BfmA/BtgA family mobilization protein n=1 Tax=Salegentibacter sp. Hel_I_6 TaxID=1250278 RepID=UPI00069085A8|nr:BfmA/BtgA family mobilization protein [Salegentibacter sp. Hel_I_6]
MKNKSIQIQEKHHKDLQKLSESLGQSYGKLVEKMILYFKRTGIDPDDLKNESPSHKIQQLDKRLVSFLKVQERDILKPLRQETYEYYQNYDKTLKDAKANINKNLGLLDNNSEIRANHILKELAKQRKALITLSEHLDPANKKGLKTVFQNIFKNAN